MSLDQLLGVVGLTIADVREGRVEPGVGGAVASLARAYTAIMAQARAVITVQEAAAAMDILVEAVLRSDPTDEVRTRIVEEYERLLPLRSA